jgi:hypothetical protein
MIVRGIDRWHKLYLNKRHKLYCAREDEESQLPEMLRILNKTPSVAEHVAGTTREVEEL